VIFSEPCIDVEPFGQFATACDGLVVRRTRYLRALRNDADAVLDDGCRMGDDHVAVLRKAQMNRQLLCRKGAPFPARPTVSRGHLVLQHVEHCCRRYYEQHRYDQDPRRPPDSERCL